MNLIKKEIVTKDDLTELLDASTWAVFESIGIFLETLQNGWDRIYSAYSFVTRHETSKLFDVVGSYLIDEDY